MKSEKKLIKGDQKVRVVKGNKEGHYKQNVERVARDLAELYRLPGNHSPAGKFDKAKEHFYSIT